MCLIEKYNTSWLEAGVGKPGQVQEHDPTATRTHTPVQTPAHPALSGGTVSGLQAGRSQK